MAPPCKLTEQQVKKIRQRVHKGAQLTALAKQFDVNRKTLRRRLDALERVEAARAARAAAARQAKQLAAERKKLKAIRAQSAAPLDSDPPAQPGELVPRRDPYHDWLDTRKNLSGSERTEAFGLVRVRNPDGTIHQFVKRSEVDALLEQGWTIDSPRARHRK